MSSKKKVAKVIKEESLPISELVKLIASEVNGGSKGISELGLRLEPIMKAIPKPSTLSRRSTQSSLASQLANILLELRTSSANVANIAKSIDL